MQTFFLSHCSNQQRCNKSSDSELTWKFWKSRRKQSQLSHFTYKHQESCVLTCSQAKVSCLLTCSHANVPRVPYVLMCSSGNVPCVLTYRKYLQFLSKRSCSFTLSCIGMRKAYGIKCENKKGNKKYSEFWFV